MDSLASPIHDSTDFSKQNREQNAVATKLDSLFNLLDQLGWLIASEIPHNPDTFALRLRTNAHFGKTHISRIELDTHLFDVDSKNTLHRSKSLVVWRVSKNRKKKLKTNQPLTKREREVRDLLHCGFSLSAIATDLGISQRTAEKHVENLYRKLGVNSYNELIFGKPSD